MSLKMQNAGKNCEPDDCGTSTDTSGSPTGNIEVKDVADVEIEADHTSSASNAKSESKEEADSVLKR